MKFNELYESILNERFVNKSKEIKNKWVDLSDTDIKKDSNLADELFDLVDTTYKGIGGHVNFQTSKDFPGKVKDWKAVDIDDDPEPDVVFADKQKGGNNKSVLTATDGSKEAKKVMLDQKVKDLNTKGNIAEVSDALAHVLITRYKVPFVNDEQKVRDILQKDIKWVGENPNGKYPGYDGWYERILGDGKPHLKIMVGTPN